MTSTNVDINTQYCAALDFLLEGSDAGDETQALGSPVCTKFLEVHSLTRWQEFFSYITILQD